MPHPLHQIFLALGFGEDRLSQSGVPGRGSAPQPAGRARTLPAAPSAPRAVIGPREHRPHPAGPCHGTPVFWHPQWVCSSRSKAYGFRVVNEEGFPRGEHFVDEEAPS